MNLRLILRIARTELAVLFYSPVAWLLLIAFTCQVGFDFMNILTEIVKIKALGNTITFSVTAGFVLGLKGIYEVIQETIYLYIPLLTMNLMSREYSSGSIKLLYSSPVNSIQIITGKFVSMVVLGSTDSKKGAGNLAGLAIGLTLVLVHIVCIPITGTSVNPARSIAPALFQGGEALSQLWLFIIAPFVGAALSAVV